MFNATNSIKFFGTYLSALGLATFVVPNTVLPLLGFPTTTEVWIRLVGLLTATLGMYFLYSARHKDFRFYRATIYARLIFFAGVAILVIFGQATPLLIAFGLDDLAGAGWTWWALRKS